MTINKNLSQVPLFILFIFVGLISYVARSNSEENGQVSQSQQNFRQALNRAGNDWAHTVKGREFYEMGNYEKSIEEYQKAIQIIEANPDEKWQGVAESEMIRINGDRKAFAERLPRYRLVEVFEKTGRYPEALEQIDWLLAHKPIDHVRRELLARKSNILKSAEAHI